MKLLPADSATPVTPAPDVPAAAAVAPAAAAATEDAPAAGLPARQAVERAVSRANEQIASVAPALQFEVDPRTHEVVIRLIDRQDQHVLRQIPAPEMLEIARALERMQSTLLRGKA